MPSDLPSSLNTLSLVSPDRLFRIDGKRALITGAGSGIGASIAQTFARAGAEVFVVDRDAAAGERTVATIQASAGRATCYILDVTQERDALDLATRLPRLDVLVNCAGVGHVGDLERTTAADLDRLLAVNVRGVFNLCKAFAPAMLQQRSGSVINIASVAGLVAVRERLAYTTSKFAVVGLTKALALDHSHTGVRFNAICPGRVETPFVLARLAESKDPEATRREMAATQLTGRMALPDEVAAAALYLAADVSAMVIGSTLQIDGGWTVGK
jgi:NAD(P)-dependent dehydrogenase (short-subunit alcohol dehydrogenase family)